MEISIIEQTKKLIEETNQLLDEKNKKYYLNVLDFLNMMFEDNAKNILRIKFQKITLNQNVFLLYNKINEVYGLEKPKFEYEKFEKITENIDEPDEIKKIWCEIALNLSNYLLDRLGHKLKIKKLKNDSKIKFIITDI